MSEFLNLFNDASAQWGALMLRASVSGGMTIMLLWGLCRIFPKMSPTGRSWLWRAAFCKLFLALFWQTSVGVPVLPATMMTTPHDASPSIVMASGDNLTQASRDVDFSSPAINLTPLPTATTDSISNAMNPNTVGVASHQVATPITLTLTSIGLGCWLLGVAFLMGRGVRAWRATRRLVAESQPLDNTILSATLEALRQPLGLVRLPELRSCPGMDALALTGVLKPKILLPPQLTNSNGTFSNGIVIENGTDIELMLAHELAHQKRGDLAWNWLLLTGQTLFWFHPLVWLGAREWRMAQEVACDALAVRATSTPVATYGAMLMKIALSPGVARPETLFAVGVGERYATLHRRLSAMKYFPVRAESRRAMLLCAALGLSLLVPWRVTARSVSAQSTLNQVKSAPATASEPFYVPGGSMGPMLPVGSIVQITRPGYANVAQVRRGDMVVHTLPGRPKTAQAVKRVIALPGDTLRLSGTSVWLNGRQLPHRRVSSNSRDVYIFQESNNGSSYQVAYDVQPEIRRKDFSVTVAQNTLFIVGDNRHNANDSRSYGALPFHAIMGKVLKVSHVSPASRRTKKGQAVTRAFVQDVAGRPIRVRK